MWKKTRTYHIAWWKFPRKSGLILLLIAVSGILYMLPNDEAAVTAMADGTRPAVREAKWRVVPSGRDSLLCVMPTMAGYYGTVHGWHEEWRRWLRETIGFCTGVYPDDWVSVLARQFPYRASAGQRDDGQRDVVTKPIFGERSSDKVRIGIYHTHTAESFIPSSGKAHASGGQRGEIVEVGAFLAECLAKYGIKAVQNTDIHDYPNFMHAYSASEKTASEMVRCYPSLDMVFDIHRDASKRSDAVVTIDGKTCAKVLIIVAQGQKGLAQPHWQENYRLAKALEQTMEELYPGLSGGIQLTEWRYNQHLHQHALLLEVGSHETSKGEAMRSMKMMAEVIAKLLGG